MSLHSTGASAPVHEKNDDTDGRPSKERSSSRPPSPSRRQTSDIESSPSKHEKDDLASERSDHSNHPPAERTTSKATSIHDPSAKPALSLPREIIFIALISSAQLLTQAALAQSIAPLHIIGSSFARPNSPTPGQLSWFPAGYSLTVGTFVLPAGRLGDMYGHKLLFTLGYAWFGLWSVVAGLSVYSSNMIFFDFCRAMQGIGPAILLPTALAILGQTYPAGPRKDMVFSIFGATAPNGFLVGALFSALIAEYAWWPWAYWLLGIVCFACAAAARWVIPEPSSSSSLTGSQHFDYLGAATGVAGLVLFNVAWNQAPNAGWSSPYIVVFLVLGILFFIAFLLMERRVAQPLLPVGALSGSVAFVLGCIALGWSSFGIWLYFYWQFTTVLQGRSPLAVVPQFVPTGISGLIAALTTGLLLSRLRVPWIMFAAMCAFCAGNVIFATLDPSTLYWKQAFWALLITPWGMDMSFPAATIILSGAVPRRHQGIAASLVNTVVNYSISLGLGIAGTIQANVDPEGVDLLKSYRGAWYAAIGLAGLGIVLAGSGVVNSYVTDMKKRKRTV